MWTIDAAGLRAALPMRAAIDALHEAFAAPGDTVAPLRDHHETPGGSLLVMPAWGSGGTGIKLVTVTPGNPAAGLPFVQAVYVLFAPGSQTPGAVIDGTALTALRTAAVSGLATRLLAREDARRLVVFGAGVQAEAHIEAMRAVRSIDDVVIVGRDPARAAALAERTGARTGGADAVREADIVCTCTTSGTPVVRGSDIADGAHVNAIGAYTPATRELDTEAIARARVVVETREAALAEAGELCLAIEEGAIDAGHIVADLGETARGAEVRRAAADLTVFVGVGLAFEDLVVARAAIEAMG
jgi:ornithine cyclodeaminase